MRDTLHPPSGGVAWLQERSPMGDIVVSTRVRLARNLRGLRFGVHAGDGDRKAVLDLVRRAAEATPQLRDGTAYPVAQMSRHARQLLHERHLVSREFVGGEREPPPAYAALFLAPEEALGAMVNEEDHLRIQSLVSGLRIRQAWELANALDDALAAQLPYAFHPSYGYLTSCPTNVGTGLRASVLLHLPGLVLTQEIAKVLQGLTAVGLTFRGLYGEGSEVIGNFFQISNQTTLGRSEEELLEHLERTVRQVLQYEQRARGVLLRDVPRVIEDKVWRAYGLLRYARSLSFEEAMNLLSGVRLGVSLNLLPGPSVYALNQIMIFAQAAHLEHRAGRALAPAETDEARAAYIRESLEAAERAAS